MHEVQDAVFTLRNIHLEDADVMLESVLQRLDGVLWIARRGAAAVGRDQEPFRFAHEVHEFGKRR